MPADLDIFSVEDADDLRAGYEKVFPGATKSVPAYYREMSADAYYLDDSRGTASGVAVNVGTAMQVGAVLACVRVIAEDVGKLPLHLKQYSRKPGRGGRVRVETADMDEHPMFKLMRRPNEYMTAQQFVETVTAIAVLTGTGYVLKNRSTDASGRDVRELWPLLAGQCVWRKDIWQSEKELWFDVWFDATDFATVPASSMVRVVGPSMNGFEGIDVMRHAREAIGLSKRIVEAQAAFYGKNQRPSGVLSSKMPLKPEQRTLLMQQWDAKFGPGGDGGVAVLDGEFGYSPMTISATDADTIKLWQEVLKEACRMFRVTPAKVMQADGNVSYGSLEQANQNHLTDTLEPWLIRWEQSLARDLLSTDEQDNGLVWAFNRDEIVRPLPKDRWEMYTKARQANVITVNEIRDREDMPSIDDERADDPFTAVATNPGGNPSTSKTPTATRQQQEPPA